MFHVTSYCSFGARNLWSLSTFPYNNDSENIPIVWNPIFKRHLYCSPYCSRNVWLLVTFWSKNNKSRVFQDINESWGSNILIPIAQCLCYCSSGSTPVWMLDTLLKIINLIVFKDIWWRWNSNSWNPIDLHHIYCSIFTAFAIEIDG